MSYKNLLNLQEIDTESALSLVRFFLKSNQNVLLLGRSGIGKSTIPLQVAVECGYKVAYINLSAVDKSDIQGLPIFNDTSDVIHYKSPFFLPPLAPNQKPDTILLFDEVDKCDRDITAPLLEILQRRSINGKALNVVGCVLTGNLPEERAFSNDISSALLDRCAKYILTFDFEKWLGWARDNGVHDLILGFLNSNPEYACGAIESGLSMASPSPRGWTLASDALIKARMQKVVDIPTITNIIAGFVGKDTAFQFKIWYQFYRQFEPVIASLIENGTCHIDYTKLTPTERLVFCVSACHLAKTKFIRESKSKPKYRSVENLCRFLVENKVAPEVQAIGLSNSFPLTIITNPKYRLYSCQPFFELISKLSGSVINEKTSRT